MMDKKVKSTMAKKTWVIFIFRMEIRLDFSQQSAAQETAVVECPSPSVPVEEHIEGESEYRNTTVWTYITVFVLRTRN